MRRLAALSAAVVLALVSVGSAAANHAWGNYHWERSSNPLHLDLGSNLTGGWSTANYFDVALSDWNSSSVLDLSEVPGAGLKNCGAVAGRVEVCNDTYGYRQGGWLGLAQIWVSGDHIVQGVVKVNDTFLYGSATYSTSAWRQLVMCQEIGHTFGLDHQDENFNNPNLGTCMDYTSSPGTNQHPNQHDYQQLEDIYAHTDGSGGGGGGGGGGDSCPERNPHCSGGAGLPPFAQASPARG
ncbi:MAG TPA: hypothetical protein VK831_03560, partial [Candidatus Deferrimicrobiaceae bacterium]|nr:hypothetical protein [Candidatus Deferrimicrobiaceae bacterium]